MSDASGFRRALPAIAVAFTLAFVAFSGFVVFSWFHEIPYQDSWGIVPQYRWLQEGRLPASVFWETHNEHKIPILRLLFLADYRLAAGTGLLLIALTLLAQAAHALLLARALGRIEGLPDRDRIFLACAAALTGFWLVQSGNFTWNFQVAWFLNALAATLAAYGISGLRRDAPLRFNAWRIGAAALFTAVAAYNVANGLFLCAVLLPVLWKARLPRGYLVFWLLFTVALFAAYFLGASAQGAPRSGVGLETLRYFLAYLGNPVTRFSLPAGMLLGAAGLAAFLVVAGRYLARPAPAFFDHFAFAQLAYVAVTAAITAVGRSSLGADQASSSRYYTTVLTFWLFLFFLAWREWGSAPRARAWVRGGALAVFALFVLPIQALSVPQREARYVKADEAALALIAGVADTATLHYICVTDSVTWGEGAYLKQARLSVFREDWTHLQGVDLSSRLSVVGERDPARAPHAVLEEVRRVADDSARTGYFVRGRFAGGAAPAVLLFAREGIVAGAAKSKGRDCAGCFSGYARGDDARFEAFALDASGKARRVRLLPAP